MNHYVNLCPPYCETSDTLTVDIPTEYMDDFLRLVYALADEQNVTPRKAFGEMVKYTYYNLMEKTYERKNRKNAKRGRRDS